MSKGKAIIFSAPSGAGKTTIVKHLLDVRDDLSFSISACSRPRRNRTEVDGVDYYFLSVDDFKRKVTNDEFVEWEEVYKDSFYGTLKSEIERIWRLGKTVIFDVDVVGGKNLKTYFGEDALAIFVKPPSINHLRNRLKLRDTETEESINTRMAKAEKELGYAAYFDYILVNDNLENAFIDAEKTVSDFLDK